MSEDSAFAPVSRLTVCIDFKSPHAWLAVQPTRALEAELGIAADWLPVITRVPAGPRAATASDDRGTRHRHMRAEYYEHDLQRYAALRGLPLGRASRSDDSSLAAIGLLWVKSTARASQARYIDGVFSSYFTHGEPIALASLSAIAEIVAAVGADADGYAAFAAQSGPAELATLQNALNAAGLSQAPSYLVDGDVFNGRAHLPMIGWLLTDRRGPPPI